jgi:hypothetical protein
MNSIILKDEELDYWKKHSTLIKELAEDNNSLKLELEWFPNFNEDDFKFLKQFFHKKNIGFTDSKKYGTFVYNIKGYTDDRAEFVLDYIMYMKPKNVTKLLQRKIKEIRKNNNSNNFYNYNNNNTSNYNETSKKEKYRSNIRINNNNNSVPYGKTLKKKTKKGVTLKKH